MIQTFCTNCNEVMLVDYECKDGGAGIFTEIPCKECGATNYVELTSMGGWTLSVEEIKKWRNWND